MFKRLQTAIIGGGQGGLSASYHLKQQGHEHIVFEQAAQAGNAWRNDRWDSFTLVTPNWSFRMPGAEYTDADPDGFMPRAEIVARLEQYVEQYDLPVQFGVCVHRVENRASGYEVYTDHGNYLTDNVVMANGLYQRPRFPAFSASLDKGILQLPSGKYRNPQVLPPGAVLVVGSGQSGCQIAEELYMNGRKVLLCTGSAGRAPRRYRGQDVIKWLYQCGFLDRTPEQLSSAQARFASNPLLTGKDGGHSLNLHQFHRDGVTLLGRLQGIQDGSLILAPVLKENLAQSDRLESEIVMLIDGYIEENGIDVPQERLDGLNDGYSAPEIESLNLIEAGIKVIIWAIGYQFDFSLVKLPIFDESGFPQTERGVTRYPGLYFVGLPWLNSQKTGLFMGVGEQAAYIAEKICVSR